MRAYLQANGGSRRLTDEEIAVCLDYSCHSNSQYRKLQNYSYSGNTEISILINLALLCHYNQCSQKQKSLPQRGRWQPLGLTDEEIGVCTA